MVKKQTKTTDNKIASHRYLYEDLPEKQQQAIFYRYGGWRYERIARELGFTYQRVREYFMANGECRAAYDELCSERTQRNKMAMDALKTKIEEMLPEMIEVLEKSAQSGNWQAAMALLDRGGFGPSQKIEATVDQSEKEEVIRLIKELRDKIKDTSKNILPSPNELK